MLLEIPMALTHAEAAALCDLADARGKTLMICHTERYWASTRELKRWIVTGELTPSHIHVEWHFFRREKHQLDGETAELDRQSLVASRRSRR